MSEIKKNQLKRSSNSSELPALEDSDEEDNTSEVQESLVAEGEIKEVYEAEVQVVGSKEKEVDEGEQELVKTEELNKNKEPLMNNTTFKEKEFSLPAEHADEMKSSQYFKRF